MAHCKPVTLRISLPTERDIVLILVESLTAHGELARDRYSALIEAALRNIIKAPDGIGARPRPETGNDTYSWSLSTSKNHTAIIEDRVKNPVHTIYYRYQSGGARVTVRRILHERMSPERYLS